MVPLSITAAAASLSASVFTLIKSIGAFVATVRNSRTELEAVSRELISLHVCLDVLETDRRNDTLFGQDLEVSVQKVLVNIDVTCGQIDFMLAKLKSGRYGRPIKWAIQQKNQITQYRSSLETHKSALQIALQMNTISIVIKETTRLRASQPPLLDARCADASSTAIEQINQKVDHLTRAHEQSPILQSLQDAMAELSSSVKDAVSKHQGLAELARQSCQSVQDQLNTIQDVNGLHEMKTKLREITVNPFADSFDETIQVYDPGIYRECPEGLNFSDGMTGRCFVCSGDLSCTDEDAVQAKLQD